MQQLPTPDDAEVARALAAIEAAKAGADRDLVECLDAIADMVSTYRDPELVFDRVQDALRFESLHALAASHGLNLYESTTLKQVEVYWPVFALVPRGQKPAESLAQLRRAIAEREREQYLADSFQASVAAGHVEDVESWYSRTSRAWKAR